MRRVARALMLVFGVAALLTGRDTPAQSGYRQVDAQLMRRYKNATSLYEKARASFGKNDLEGARSLLRSCLARMPELAEAHLMMAKIHYLQKDFSQALVEVELARSGHEATADLIESMRQDRLSELRQRRDAKIETINRLQGLLAQASPESQRGLQDQITRAEAEGAELDRELAEPFAAADELPAEYTFLHANILLRLHRYAEAEAQYEQTLKADPTHASAVNNLAALHLSTGQGEKAAEVLARAEARGVAVNPELKQAVAAAPPRAPGAPGTGGDEGTRDAALPILTTPDLAPATTQSGAADTTAPAGDQPPADRDLSPAPPEELRLAYVNALVHLTGGDPTATEAAVTEMERAALEDGRPESAKRLQAAELAVAAEVTRKEGEAVLALLHLHLRLAVTSGAARRAQAQAHAWNVLEELAALAARADGGRVRPRAADAMACLAGYSQRVGAGAAGERQYRIALLLDATNAAALEGLAAGLEWAGRYREAEGLLERLAAQRPDAQEPWLRLAVTRQRLGDSTRVETLLRSCVVPGAPTWIRAVAWQELARRRLDAEEWDPAARLLAEAATALPEDREIAAMQAYALDRSGRRAEARVIAERLAAHATRTASARFVYSQRPGTEFERGCEALSTYVADVPTVALGRALAAAPDGGGQ